MRQTYMFSLISFRVDLPERYFLDTIRSGVDGDWNGNGKLNLVLLLS